MPVVVALDGLHAMKNNEASLLWREGCTIAGCFLVFFVCNLVSLILGLVADRIGGTAMIGKREGSQYFLGISHRSRAATYTPVSEATFHAHEQRERIYPWLWSAQLGSLALGVAVHGRGKWRRRQSALQNR